MTLTPEDLMRRVKLANDFEEIVRELHAKNMIPRTYLSVLKSAVNTARRRSTKPEAKEDE